MSRESLVEYSILKVGRIRNPQQVLQLVDWQVKIHKFGYPGQSTLYAENDAICHFINATITQQEAIQSNLLATHEDVIMTQRQEINELRRAYHELRELYELLQTKRNSNGH